MRHSIQQSAMDRDSDYEHEYEQEIVTVGAGGGCDESTSTGVTTCGIPPVFSKYLVEDRPRTTSWNFQVWTVVPPPLDYMVALHNERQEISGRQVWTGSLYLANLLIYWSYCGEGTRTDLSTGTAPTGNGDVLELGSGTGILGMTVARLIMEQQESEHDKMRSVLLTDGDDQAVRLLQQNLSNPYNGFLNHGDTCDIGACKLRWGNESDYADLRKRRRRIDFDCIVAGDVLYKTELPPLFFQTVDVFLSREKKTDFVPVLYLCHVPRASVTHEVVQEAARAAGFDIETITGGFPSSMISAGCPLDDSSRARVYRITRCPHGT